MANDLEHIKGSEPDALERKFEMYWCRRCGRALETFDGRVLAGAAKPCQVVKLALR